MENNKNKHLTLDDRINIQTGITNGKNFKSLGIDLGKDPTTISKEVKRNFVYKDTSVTTKNFSGDILTPECSILKKPPYVCNSCKYKRRDCGFTKRFYYAEYSHKKYLEQLSEARTAIVLNKEEFYEMDKIVSKGVKKGQSFYHIIKSNELPISSTSLYRYTHKGYFTITPLDCKRVVKFRRRRTVNTSPIPKHLKEGRSYADFISFLTESEQLFHLEMDTVLGRVGGKSLLTFNISSINFMFCFVLENNTSNEVISKLSLLKEKFLKNNLYFSDVFPVILTDNGSEFSKVEDIEQDFDKKLKLFFCNPNSPHEKGKIEKNHTTLREILPKGTNFDNLTQSDINIIISHINSFKRKYLNGKSPYEMMKFTFGEDIIKLLGIFEIPANEVTLTPSLVKLIKEKNL